MPYDYEADGVAIEFKKSSQPKLADEHDWDGEDGFAMLDRWQDRKYAIHNTF